jgi:hypothetical protein
MEAIRKIRAPLRSAEGYAIDRAGGLDGWSVVDQARQPAIVVDLAGQAQTV